MSFNREYKEGQVEGEATEVLTAAQYADSENFLTCVWGLYANYPS